MIWLLARDGNQAFTVARGCVLRQDLAAHWKFAVHHRSENAQHVGRSLQEDLPAFRCKACMTRKSWNSRIQHVCTNNSWPLVICQNTLTSFDIIRHLSLFCFVFTKASGRFANCSWFVSWVDLKYRRGDIVRYSDIFRPDLLVVHLMFPLVNLVCSCFERTVKLKALSCRGRLHLVGLRVSIFIKFRSFVAPQCNMRWHSGVCFQFSDFLRKLIAKNKFCWFWFNLTLGERLFELLEHTIENQIEAIRPAQNHTEKGKYQTQKHPKLVYLKSIWTI